MKKWFGVCLLCLLATAQARPWLLLFGSTNCDQCAEVKARWMEERELTDEGAVLVFVNVDNENNYRFLKWLEKALKVERPSITLPVMLAGNRMLESMAEFEEAWPKLDELLKLTPRGTAFQTVQQAADQAEDVIVEWDYAPAPARRPPEASSSAEQAATQEEPVADATKANTAPKRLLYVETAENCQHCERQSRELDLLAREMPGLEVTRFEVTTPEGQIMLARVKRHFNLATTDENLAPIVVWNGGFVSGRIATVEELAGALKGQEASETPFWEKDITEEEREELHEEQRAYLKNVTVWTILGGGLVDGINPCTFATSIFLIGYLLYLKRRRHFVLAVGLCFCAGVFVSYLLFGVGLSFIGDFLTRFRILKVLIYGFFALVGFVFAVLHLRDAIRYRRSGKATDMSMGLDTQTHRKIHDRIHSWSKMTGWLALPGAVVLGCVVSSMEFVCTGQVYLPMIMAIIAEGFDWRAFQLLLLYNLAFILPLIGVTLLAYFGVGANKLTKFAKDNVFQTKLLMTVLFLVLGGVMLAFAWRAW
ncbi:MAG: hypothetical protein II943_12830 [Victivallales bacterium]|nr:hypothetical protein [Victivallales bacterium]